MARFVFSCIITSIAIASIWSSDGYTVHNSLLAGHVFKSVVSIDWLQCIEECHKHDRCVSYNYFPPEKICELNDFGFYDRCEADDNLIRSDGWIHRALRISQEMKGKRKNSELPEPKGNFTATFTCDNVMEMFADGRSLGQDENWRFASTFQIPGDTRVISVRGKNSEGPYGVLGSFSNGLVTNESWKCSIDLYPKWNSPDFDDGHWSHAVAVGKHGDKPWKVISGIALTAQWIWAAGDADQVYCRLDLQKQHVSL